MPNGIPKRPRSNRVSRLDLPPGVIEAAFDKLQQRDVLLRLGLCIVAGVIIWALTGAGARPFPYRLGDVPSRNIVARYAFSRPDEPKTLQAKTLARNQARSVFDNKQEVLVGIRDELKNNVVSLTQSKLPPETMKALWVQFVPNDEVRTALLKQFPAPAKPAVKQPDPKTSNEAPAAAPGSATPAEAPASPASAPKDPESAPPPTEAPKTQAVSLSPDVVGLALASFLQPAADKSPPIESTTPATPKETEPKETESTTASESTASSPPATNAPTAEPPAETSSDKPAAHAPDNTTPPQPPTMPPATPATVAKPPAAPLTPDDVLRERFREALLPEGNLDRFKAAVDEVFAPLLKHGVLDAMPADHDGNPREIRVRSGDDDGSVFQIGEVLTGDVLPEMRDALSRLLESKLVAEIAFRWLQGRQWNSLELNNNATKEAKDRAEASVKDVVTPYRPGDLLAVAGTPLDLDVIKLLGAEHDAESAQPTLGDRLMRTAAVFGMFLALFSLCGFYITFREPRLVANLARFILLLTMATLAVLLSYAVASELRAEIIPLMIFGMTMAIAYQQELAMLLSAAVALAVVFLAGYGLASFVVLTATVSVAVLLLGRIRSRRKLIYVGLTAGAVSMFTSLGVNTLAGPDPTWSLVYTAAWCGLWSLVASFLMTGLLPFIENLFGVQTDLSLMELGDVAHPLLQELVRRAPGTYNHSIMVASIGEAAAEAIGAHGLLVRVGAYFHDIGKMLKPGYFVENQGVSGNRHEDLVPAMSTLIIIAHVKDGADLARQHHLPQAIIDFIQQHHGTTLVEYFYGRAAAEQRTQNPDRPVDESSFRYPGPKPQTKEAAVLMLADAVESASRSLVEPAPARIESLVEDIAMKRLLDGQFDACGLTLQELQTIEDSLVKSLIAVYHGRVKYPDQRTA